MPEEGPDIYKGQIFPFSMPFSLKFDPRNLADREVSDIFTLGANLASFYSMFWSASPYRSPQVFLFSPDARYDITVPAAGRGRGKLENEPFIDVIRQVIVRQPQDKDWGPGSRIVWRSYVEQPDQASPPRVLAYANVPCARARQRAKPRKWRRWWTWPRSMISNASWTGPCMTTLTSSPHPARC